MEVSKGGTSPTMREKRKKILDEMLKKGTEMQAKLGNDYSHWDYICLMVLILTSMIEMIPQFHNPAKFIVGTLVDGEMQTREDRNNGILSIKS